MAKKPQLASLDLTGTQAAVYPSEEQLWVVGPPINDPGSQGVLPPDPGGLGGQAADDFLHDQINGPTSDGAYDEWVVNPTNWGPTGLGDPNVQDHQSGPTNNVILDPSLESGWGVGPARRWPHYPKVVNVNPTRNFGTHLRNGSLPIVQGETALWDRGLFGWEAQWIPKKQRGAVAPVVPVPTSVPYGTTVPTYSGGPSSIVGVDVPYETEGIY